MTIRTISLALIISSSMAVADWTAGLDLESFEDTGTGLSGVNSVIPEWSYGWRPSAESTSFTAFAPSEYLSAYGSNSNVPGWTNGTVALGVNTGATDAVFDFGFGPLEPVNPSEIVLHPGDGAFVVVRWVAPTEGTYTLDSYWSDLDDNGGNGGVAYVTLNGVSLASGTWNNGAETGFADNRTIALAQGDIIDFVAGTNFNSTFDTTSFDATITPVPEPAVTALAICGTIALVFSRRLRRH